jgi:hypothetical protein
MTSGQAGMALTEHALCYQTGGGDNRLARLKFAFTGLF